MVKIIIGVIIAAFVVIGGFMLLDPQINGNNTQITTDTNDASAHTFTIEGEVSKPGTYSLEENATMDQLIIAAGGLTSNGDVRTYFSETVLESGVTYYVGGVKDAADVCSSEPITKVNINSDTAETLMSVNGITSSVSSAIVSHRSEIGSYTYLEQLLDVYGIGNATYRKIRNYVILHQ